MNLLRRFNNPFVELYVLSLIIVLCICSISAEIFEQDDAELHLLQQHAVHTQSIRKGNESSFLSQQSSSCSQTLWEDARSGKHDPVLTFFTRVPLIKFKTGPLSPCPSDF